jgi:hypothetical protein
MREHELHEADKTDKAVKKYIEIQYSPTAQGYLREYCIDNDFNLSTRFNGDDQPVQAFDFHSTVWFTTNSVVMSNYSQDVEINDIEPKGFALFGPDENILVLEIDSAEIRSIRDTLGEQYGLEDEWPEYRPHITLSYAFAGDAIPTVSMPDGEMITGDELHVKDQK